MSDFGRAFANMLYDRLDDGQLFQKLQNDPHYTRSREACREAYRAIFGGGEGPGSNLERDFLNALLHLRDLELQYIYRAGVQDGISLSKVDFLVDGLSQELGENDEKSNIPCCR